MQPRQSTDRRQEIDRRQGYNLLALMNKRSGKERRADVERRIGWHRVAAFVSVCVTSMTSSNDVYQVPHNCAHCAREYTRECKHTDIAKCFKGGRYTMFKAGAH